MSLNIFFAIPTSSLPAWNTALYVQIGVDKAEVQQTAHFARAAIKNGVCAITGVLPNR